MGRQGTTRLYERDRFDGECTARILSTTVWWGLVTAISSVASDRGQRVAVLVAAIAITAVVAVAIGVVPTAAALEDSPQTTDGSAVAADDALSSGGTFYIGQQLFLDTGTNEEATWRIYEVSDNGSIGAAALEFVTDEDGTAVIDTATPAFEDAQEYAVGPSRDRIKRIDESGRVIGAATSAEDAAFTVYDQFMFAHFDSTTVEQGETVSIRESSRRGFYDVEITSEQLSAETLRSIFGGRETDAGTQIAAQNLSSADFSEIGPGSYTIHFDVVDSTASDSETITIVDPERDRADDLTSGTEYWTGNRLSLTTDTDETWGVYRVSDDGTAGSLVTEVDPDDDGAMTIDTTAPAFEGGQSYVVGPSRTEIKRVDGGTPTETVSPAEDAAFALTDQGFSLSFLSSAAEAGETVGITKRSARSAYLIEITADGLTSAELQSIFGGISTSNGTLVESDELTTANVSGVDPGAYTFTFDVRDTTATDTASITVLDPKADPTLTSGDRYWTGRQIALDTDIEDELDWGVYRVTETGSVGALVTEVASSADGPTVLDTSSDAFEGGERYVVGSSSDDLKTFEAGAVTGNASTVDDAAFTLLDQPYSVLFSPQIEDRGEPVRVLESSPRTTYEVEITAESLDADEIHRVFGGTQTAEGTVVAAEKMRSANVSAIDPGEYTFTFNVTDTTASDQATVTLKSHNTTLSTPDSVRVTRGNVASIPVTMNGTDTAYVSIGQESEDGFRAIVELSDGNDDGEITLEANTYTMTDQGAPVDDTFWTADDGDSVETVWYNGTSDERPLPAGTDSTRSYDVRLSTDFDTTAYEHTGDRDRTVLRVSERSTDTMSMWTAPASADITNVEDVRDAISNDTLTESQLITEGDYAVAELQASGIFGALEVQPGSNYAEKLVSLDENVSSLNFSFEKPAADVLYDDNMVELAADEDALTVIPDQEDGRLFVLMDTAALDLEDGDIRVPTFTVHAGNTTDTLANSETDDVTTEMAFEMVSPEVTFDQNEVSPAANQTISGESNLAPGTELTFTVESAITPDSESAFIEEFTATVEDDGTWSGRADFSEGQDGQGYTVSVIEPDIAASYDEVIGRPKASISAANATEDTLTIDSVELSEGGFVVVRSGSATGSFAGVSDYLEPGRNYDVEVSLSGISEGETVSAVAHTDDNENGEFDGDATYKNANGSPVSESLTVSSVRDVDSYRSLTSPTDELQPSAVMQAKGDYLAGEIDLSTVVKVMRAYFFG